MPETLYGMKLKNFVFGLEHDQPLWHSTHTVLCTHTPLHRTHSLGTIPNKKEIRKAITGMKSDKAPGISQLTTDMLKNLLNDALDFIIETIQEFWNQDTNFTAWHVTKLNILYKG
jgi:hypothetical protein